MQKRPNTTSPVLETTQSFCAFELLIMKEKAKKFLRSAGEGMVENGQPQSSDDANI